MYALAVTNLGTMGYSPFDIGYDAFYKRDSYFEDNAGVGFATTNVLQNVSANVTPAGRPRVMDLAFLVSGKTGCCTELGRCETPSIHVQAADFGGQPDPPTPTDSSILTLVNLGEAGTNSLTGSLEAQETADKHDTRKRYKPRNGEYLHGVPVRIKTTNILGRDVPRSVTRQAPKKVLPASRHGTTRPDFEKLSEVLEKIEKISSQGDTIYACPVCPSELTTKTSFQEHLKQHLAEQTFECHLCLRRFKTEQSLQKHIGSHSKLTFECHICHKVLCSVPGYKMHMESHSGITYECTICNRELLSKSSFDGHMRKHIENTVYECTFCHKKLKYKLTLNEHMRLHTGEKPYECKICHMKMTTSQILRNHMKKHK